jgi:O-antigen ligase
VYAGAAILLVLAVAVVVSTSNLVVAVVVLGALIGLVGLLVLGLERLTIATLVVAFATAPMYRGLEGLTGGLSTPTDLVLVLATILLLPVVITRHLELPTTYVVGLLMVALFGLVACAFADQPASSVFELIRWLFFLGAVPILIAWWRPSPRTVSLLLWSYVAGHVLSTLDALAEGPTVGNRYQGLTHHTNAFGMAGVTAIAILLYLSARHRSTLARVAAGSAGALSLLSIVLSGSRAALAVAVVLILLVPIVERTAVSSVVLGAGVVMGAIALPILLHSGDGGSALTRLAGDPTAAVADSARSSALTLGLERYWHSPVFGSGLADVEYFHNVFLEAAIGAGVVGLLGYLMALYALIRPLLSEHVFRRLSYLPLAFVGMGPALPGIWDETMWVPISLSVLAALGTVTYVRESDSPPPSVDEVSRPQSVAPAG